MPALDTTGVFKDPGYPFIWTSLEGDSNPGSDSRATVPVLIFRVSCNPPLFPLYLLFPSYSSRIFLLSEADTDKFVCSRVHDWADPDGFPQTLSSFAA